MIMLGGLYREMTLWNTLGDVLEGSGWAAALTQADVASCGTADTYMKATYTPNSYQACPPGHSLDPASTPEGSFHAY